MASNLLKSFVDILNSPIGGSNGKKGLLEKIGAVIHADLLCLNETDRQDILNQVGISNQSFTHGFQVESISNLWSIELLIINKLQCADLIARLWAVRQKFHSQVGDGVYNNYLASLPDELTETKLKTLIAKQFDDNTHTAPPTDQAGIVPALDCIKLEAAIRGDITNVTRQSQRLSYYKLLRLESIYKVKGTILTVLFTILLLMASSLFVLYGYGAAEFGFKDFKPQDFSLVVLTIFSGMIGSCLSLLQRTERASGAPSSFTDSVLDAMDIKLSMSLLYVLSLILSGAIFATILYLLAVSGTFTLGELLPKLELITDSGVCKESIGIRALFCCIKFKASNSLMLVWAFMAGFAERLVPDTLDSLMEKARKSKG